MKQISALIGALVITFMMGTAIVLIGANVLFNKNSAPLSNSPSDAASISSPTTTGSTQDPASIQQLQNLISQYQTREQQYQTQLNQAQQDIQQASSQIQQYQALIVALQQRGIISIGQDGTVSIRRGNGF